MQCHIVGLYVLVALFCTAQSQRFSYLAQNEWPGICVEGNHGYQSPININTHKVIKDERIVPLRFKYADSIDGTLENTGHSVKFVPNSYERQLLWTPLPIQNFHMWTLLLPNETYHRYGLRFITFHWGRQEGEGSEHLVDGKAEEFEAQFVYSNIVGSGNYNLGNKTVIVAVRGEETHSQVNSDIFEILDVSKIIDYKKPSLSVSNVPVTDLLPKDFNFYYYLGSLTTPDCEEKIDWYVLKETIRVPSTYLQLLRQIRDEDGNRVTFNFRYIQNTNKKHRDVHEV